jgi:CP family cyanate transporter-like MFS transporter
VSAGENVTGRTQTRAEPLHHPALVAMAIVLLALNLRTTVASLPPLLREIEDALRLSGAAAGLLTAVPVLCMAWFAPAAHRLAHRFGREGTALAAAAMVAVGNGLRFAGATTTVALYAGTFVAGLGVATCGIVLPGIVKELFPTRMGAATGAYSVAMMLGAAISAALAVPLEHLLGSWQASLAAWALPAVVACVVWIPIGPGQRARARRGGASWPAAVAERTGVAAVGIPHFSVQPRLCDSRLARPRVRRARLERRG